MNFAEGEKKHTLSPIHVGSSVIGMKYKGGLLIAADMRLNYGSLAKFLNIDDRVQRINANTMMGSAGEYSDFQEVTRVLRETALEDVLSRKSYLGPKELTNYLSALHYYKRNKMDPYWNSTVMGGLDWDKKPLLYSLDQFGTLIQSNYIVVGMAQYFCNAIISPLYPKNPEELSEEEALSLIEKCFRVLFYRDTKAGNTIKVAKMELKDNVPAYSEKEIRLNTEWDFNWFKNQANENIYLTNY